MAGRPKSTQRPQGAQSSREAILTAATAELAEKGLVGARIEHIARRAGFNKTLIYRHFGDRDGLVRAVMERQLERRWQVFADLPGELAEGLVHWYRNTREPSAFLQLLMREALEDPRPATREESRKAYYLEQVDRIREHQREGRIDAGVDPAALFLALQALISYPAFFPQLTRMVTGREADDPEFQESWEQLLSHLAQRLAP